MHSACKNSHFNLLKHDRIQQVNILIQLKQAKIHFFSFIFLITCKDISSVFATQKITLAVNVKTQ